jgi:acetyltransferase-like isoleucine patch superfamily enzyme
VLRQIYRDWTNPWVRFEYKYSLIRNIPGELGLQLRRCLLAKRFARAGSGLRVYPGVYFWNPQKMEVGDNVGIGVGSCIQASGGVRLGSNVSLGPGAKIWSANHDFRVARDRPLSELGYEFKEVVIGDNVWIGANAFIMPGVELKPGTVVTAGSVVGVKQYPERILLSGNPARAISRLE